jgi:hypothetical protein
METCKGLTVVPHEDLAKAVSNWHKARGVWVQYQDTKTLKREEIWSEISLTKRFWYRLQSGIIFQPEEYWHCVEDWCKINFPKELRGRLHHYVRGNDGWWFTQRYTAEECRKHSTQSGAHYLTSEQVLFVSKFKNLY